MNYKMKEKLSKALILILAGLAVMPAYAEYIQVGLEADGMIYVDSNTAIRNGNISKITMSAVNTAGIKKQQVEIACGQNQIRFTDANWYEGKRLVKSENYPNRQFGPVENSTDAKVYKMVCGA